MRGARRAAALLFAASVLVGACGAAGHVRGDAGSAVIAAALRAEPASRATEDRGGTVSAPERLADHAPAAAAAVPAPAVTPRAALPAAWLGDMSFVWQSLNNCGPASVVMALSTLGIAESQEVARLALRGTDARRGMGPSPVGPWVQERFGLRSVWRNNGTNDLMKRLVSNGFAPMVTQWMQDPWVSRISHWRVVRGYDDGARAFFTNDPMLGQGLRLDYGWFERNWQPFSYRYMVVYRPEDEPLLRAIIGDDWDDARMRRGFYERTKVEALEQDTMSAWLAHGEAAYAYGVFAEAVAAFERGISLGSPTGVFTLRSSYPNALRALGRSAEAEQVARTLGQGLTPNVVASPAPTVPDEVALALAAEHRARAWLAGVARDHRLSP